MLVGAWAISTRARARLRPVTAGRVLGLRVNGQQMQFCCHGSFSAQLATLPGGRGMGRELKGLHGAPQGFQCFPMSRLRGFRKHLV